MLKKTVWNYKREVFINKDLALLLTTSGSTGNPKLVRISYCNLYENAKSIVKYLEITNKEVAITILPMNYSYGLSIINSHLFAGATIILNNKNIFEKEFWELVDKYKVTSISGVPYTYELLDKINFYKMHLPSLKTITQAGGKLSNHLQKKIAEYAYYNDKRFYIMYGQTEATARMAYLPYDDVYKKIGSVGIAIPGGRFELIDCYGNVITNSNQEGELVYYGLNVAMGYAECLEDLSKNDIWCGALETGDIAKYDNDGYIYIVGRKKRFIKLYGKRISLDDIENIIKKYISNVECMCIGDDEKLDIYITDENSTELIYKILFNEMKLEKRMINMNYVKEIPKNSYGKIKYMI